VRKFFSVSEFDRLMQYPGQQGSLRSHCKDATSLSLPIFHLVGQRLPLELQTFTQELRRNALVYAFDTTEELLAGWRLARRNGPQLTFAPQAVVWLQSRAGEFQPQEVAAVQTLDPLAKPIVVAGCWSEGEPRSGKPLTGVERIYWHQGPQALLSLFAAEETLPVRAQWIAIHAAHYVDYQGLAGVCESLWLRTFWQADHAPVISSEPDLRIFSHWSSWQAWRENNRSPEQAAPAILLQDFPRPADQQRAAAEGIAAMVAQPFAAADLQRAILQSTRSSTTAQGPALRRCEPQVSYNPQPAAVFPRRRSA
jgi:hypothetical protein